MKHPCSGVFNAYLYAPVALHVWKKLDEMTACLDEGILPLVQVVHEMAMIVLRANSPSLLGAG